MGVPASRLPALLAAFAILTVIVNPAGSAADAAGGAAQGAVCDGCASAAGMVNVTLTEQPPSFTGMFLSAFDFGALSAAVSSFFTSVASLFSA